jgi:hypothetical protein
MNMALNFGVKKYNALGAQEEPVRRNGLSWLVGAIKDVISP